MFFSRKVDSRIWESFKGVSAFRTDIPDINPCQDKLGSVQVSKVFKWKWILHFVWKWKSWNQKGEWRGAESRVFEVRCEVSAVCGDLGALLSAGVGGGCSTVFDQAQSQCSHVPGGFRALHAFCLLRRCQFPFPAGLSTQQQCQNCCHMLYRPCYYCVWLARQFAWLHPPQRICGVFSRRKWETFDLKWGSYRSDLDLGNTSRSPPRHASLMQNQLRIERINFSQVGHFTVMKSIFGKY